MGADMIGFLVKGPKEIGKEQIERAATILWKTRRSGSRECHSCGGRSLRSTDECSSCGADMVPLPELTTYEDARTFVRSLVGDWPPDFCDVSSRMDPESDTDLLVFAGDMSCGEQPDGRGYQLIKTILGLGIAEALGIR
jgi:hypothetical protein